MSLFNTNVTAFPGATTTISTKEWRDHCKKHEITFFLNGHLYEFKVKNLGGGVLKLSAKPVTL
jgi:hypothetical protein